MQPVSSSGRTPGRPARCLRRHGVLVGEYLRAEQRRGRIAAGADCAGAAALLVGACFQYAFLRCFEHRQPDAAELDAYAASITDTLLAGLSARKGDRTA
jgi:hypothetical protein